MGERVCDFSDADAVFFLLLSSIVMFMHVSFMESLAAYLHPPWGPSAQGFLLQLI